MFRRACARFRQACAQRRLVSGQSRKRRLAQLQCAARTRQPLPVLRVQAFAFFAGSTLTLVISPPAHAISFGSMTLNHSQRNRGEPEAARIAARQARQILEIAQRLIGAQRVRVMIGVALQMERHQVRVDVIGVPGMVRLGQLVAAVRQLLPQRP